MKFGKEFGKHLDQTLPDWRDKFLSYKPLKKLLKQISVVDHPAPADFYAVGGGSTSATRLGADGIDHHGGDGLNVPFPGRDDRRTQWADLEGRFVALLDLELEKFNDFYVDKEEEFIIRLQELKERIERAKEKTHGVEDSESETEFSDEMIEIRKDFVAIHGEMVLPENYSSLNFAALVKILKKHDKRTGALLRLPFTQRARHQPFFTTEPLTQLVQECEANLELLFPLTAEIVEPHDSNENAGDCQNSIEASASLQEDNIEIYRSTLAAMRTIQGLRGKSSTRNPLSFATFLQNEADDESRAGTAENSVSSSSTVLQNDDNDQETSFPLSKND